MQIIIDDKLLRPVEKKPEFDAEKFIKAVEEIANSIEVDKFHPVTKTILFAWGALGFYRGVRYQSCLYKKEMDKYNNSLRRKKHVGKKPESFYFGRCCFGLLTSALYFVPLINLFYISKEMWRLEVFIRGLDEDTESERYNHLCIT